MVELYSPLVGFSTRNSTGNSVTEGSHPPWRRFALVYPLPYQNPTMLSNRLLSFEKVPPMSMLFEEVSSQPNEGMSVEEGQVSRLSLSATSVTVVSVALVAMHSRKDPLSSRRFRCMPSKESTFI